MGLIVILLNFYMIVVFVSVVLSWLPVPPDNPVSTFVNAAVDPVLAPIRRVLPDTGGIDFSPVILLIGLQVLAGLFH